jgi:hypothetical protein
LLIPILSIISALVLITFQFTFPSAFIFNNFFGISS